MVLKALENDPFDSAVKELGAPEESAEEVGTQEEGAQQQEEAPPPEQEAQEEKPQMTERQAQDMAFVSQNIDFLREVERNPRLKEHILEFFRGGSSRTEDSKPAEAKKPADADPFEGIDPEDRKYVDLMTTQVMTSVLAELRKEIEPIKQFTSSQAVKQEEARGREELVALNQQFPNWKEFVSYDQLIEAKSMRPELPVATIFRVLAFDRVFKDRAKTSQVMSDRLARTPAPESITRPRQSLRTRPRPQESVDPLGDAFEEALDRFPLLRAEGGRR